ncbi:MAG: tetratricopeptide repeat protein [Calditrichaeota bacterium]|nr:MAG: tetratricopeptide repeat protein [Calditrichota bacterium]
MLNRKPFYSLLLTVPIAWLLAACSLVPLSSENRHRQALQEAKRRVIADPQNIDAIQDLGILFYKTGQPRRSAAILKEALRRDPNDLRTVCYLGLSYERLGKVDQAFALYERYLSADDSTAYKQWIEGRYDLWLWRRIRRHMAGLIRNEKLFTDNPLDEHTVLVWPFRYHGDASRYRFLGKGLMEMMLADLQQVDSLKIVDRTRIETLAALYRKRLGDNPPEIMKRVARLMGAGSLIEVGYNVMDDSIFVEDVTRWNLLTETPSENFTRIAPLRNVLLLHKSTLVEILRSLNIAVTPEEVAAIHRLPTESVEAFLRYCRGLAYWDEEQFEPALKLFEEALEISPEFYLCRRKWRDTRLLYQATRDPDRIGAPARMTEARQK